MRLSELQGLQAFDRSGRALGGLRDVRLERGGEGWRVTHAIVGGSAFAERLGYAHGAVEKPALLARLMRRLDRHALVVPWDAVTIEGDRLNVNVERDDLERPEGYR